MLKQPYKWHGGKFYLRHHIIAQFPPHLAYVETHFGAGAVFLARDHKRDWLIDQQWKLENGETVPASLKGCSEVINDINGEVANFWAVLREPIQCQRMLDALENTEFSDAIFKASLESPIVLHEGPEFRRAVAFFIRYRQSRQGLGKSFATLSRNRTRRGMNEQVSSWLTAIEGLPDLHERLKGVVILNQDACDVIGSQDDTNTLFYCDPPYLHETRGGKAANKDYEFEMTTQQHAQLLLALTEIKGKFILSGYHSQLYDNHADQHGWRCVEIEIDNKASSKKTKETKTECLWMNYG